MYIPSGSSAPDLNIKKDSFRYYQEMKFLNDSMTSRPSTCNIPKEIINPNTNCDVDVNSVIENEDTFESSSGVMSTISNNSSNFSEHTKRKRAKSSDNEFKSTLLNIISDSNKPSDGVEGFLIQLSDILRNLPYKNRRQLKKKKIMEEAYKIEKELGII